MICADKYVYAIKGKEEGGAAVDEGFPPLSSQRAKIQATEVTKTDVSETTSHTESALPANKTSESVFADVTKIGNDEAMAKQLIEKNKGFASVDTGLCE